jgi:hypothetical protein
VDIECVARFLKLIQDVAAVGQRPGEPVQLPHDEGVTPVSRRQGRVGDIVRSRTSACEAMVEVHAVVADAECMQTITLSGEVSLLCRPPARIPPVRSSLRENAIRPRSHDRDWPPGKGPSTGHATSEAMIT